MITFNNGYSNSDRAWNLLFVLIMIGAIVGCGFGFKIANKKNKRCEYKRYKQYAIGYYQGNQIVCFNKECTTKCTLVDLTGPSKINETVSVYLNSFNYCSYIASGKCKDGNGDFIAAFICIIFSIIFLLMALMECCAEFSEAKCNCNCFKRTKQSRAREQPYETSVSSAPQGEPEPDDSEFTI